MCRENLGGRPSLSVLQEILTALIQPLGKVYIILDALDAVCLQQRRALASAIRFLTGFSQTNLIMTSRREQFLVKDLSPLLGSNLKEMWIPEESLEHDIFFYVSGILDKDLRFSSWNADLKLDITESVTSGARGMWV